MVWTETGNRSIEFYPRFTMPCHHSDDIGHRGRKPHRCFVRATEVRKSVKEMPSNGRSEKGSLYDASRNTYEFLGILTKQRLARIYLSGGLTCRSRRTVNVRLVFIVCLAKASSMRIDAKPASFQNSLVLVQQWHVRPVVVVSLRSCGYRRREAEMCC